MAGPQVDRDKLRAALRKLRPEDLFYMLEEAIDLLPQTKLLGLAKPHLKVSTLMVDEIPKEDLLTEVKTFEKRSLAGEYYESFDVNWKNCSAQSLDTTAWIADYRRFLKRCVAQERKGDPAAVKARCDPGRDKMLVVAHEIATLDQHMALAVLDPGVWS